jgi:Ni,Fe-hydrogenase maturation factor
MAATRQAERVMRAALAGVALLPATRKASGMVIVDVALTGGKRQGGATRLVGS